MIELLISIALTAVLTGAMVFAYGAAIRTQARIQNAQIAFETPYQVQSRMTQLLRHAWLETYPSTILPNAAPVTGGTTATGGAGGTTPPTPTTSTGPSLEGQASYFTSQPVSPVGGPAQTTTTTSNTGSGNGIDSQAGGGSQEVVFTAIGLPIPAGALYSSDDFQTMNQSFGAAGGVEEVSFSNQALGNGGNGQGLFIRIQRPGDYDPTQGGNESLLIPNATNISFEFWDGAVWQPTWDTPTMTPKRLPGAVRVSYDDAQNVQHVFIVRLPMSDVSVTNPVSSATRISGGTTP